MVGEGYLHDLYVRKLDFKTELIKKIIVIKILFTHGILIRI